MEQLIVSALQEHPAIQAQELPNPTPAIAPEQRHQLVIDGDAGDVVNFSDWSDSLGTVTNSGVTYNVYNQGDFAQLLIDTAVTQTGTIG